jgi:hypothetical protein
MKKNIQMKQQSSAPEFNCQGTSTEPLSTNMKLASRAITVRTPNFTTDLLLPEA